MAVKYAQEIRENAATLKRKAEAAANRVDEGGNILGWRGFHIDLDDAEQALINLRSLVRGVPVASDSESEVQK